jgi:uronate dehydrogenase
MKTVVITGAAGSIGSALRREFAGKYELRLTDRREIADLRPSESAIKADLTDLDALTNVFTGAAGVIHLGGVSKEEGWDTILPANIIGTHNVFEACRRAGARRIVFASSNHAVGFYRRDQKIGVGDPPRPDGRYGLSKVFGESIGRLYADKYGLEVFCIRIGAMTERPLDVRRLAMWVSPRDLAALVEIGLEKADLRYEIVFGMSDNKRAWWDNSNARRLGFAPQDRSEDYAAEIERAEPQHDPMDRAQIFQGGPYTTTEFIADPTKPKGQ